MRRTSKFALCLYVLFFAGALRATAAAPAVSALKIQPSGSFMVDGISFYVQHYGQEWARTVQASATMAQGYPKTSERQWDSSADWLIKNTGTAITIRQHLEKTSDASFAVFYNLSSPSPIATLSAGIALDLTIDDTAGKTISVDGKPISLPTIFKDVQVTRIAHWSQIVIPAKTGVITLHNDKKLNLYIQDDRKWDGHVFSVRLEMDIPDRVFSSGDLQLAVSYRPYESRPLDISGSCNMGFRDEVAGDRKGGWTDQGESNDLSPLKPGTLTTAGVNFQILDPAANHGTSCLAFAGSERDYFLRSAKVVVPASAPAANLYLLHAAAWMPPGKAPAGIIHARYVDGSDQRIEVISHRDVEDWWARSQVQNGVIGWTGQNASSEVCLYVSKFKLENKPLRELTFESTGKSVWMIAAASLSADDIPLAAPVPSTITAGSEWAPLDYTGEIEPGGVFDLSALNDAPAGKYGALVATPDGHFSFADRPDLRARFYGTVIAFGANFIDKQAADALAERFVRAGYNTVRMHHYDRDLVRKGGKTWEFDPQQLDRLDYVFAAFKKRGISINIDLFTLRKIPQDEVPDLGHDVPVVEFKALIPISNAAFESWKRFSTALLTHVNPYTGLSWAQDPALIGICPVNEDTIFSVFSHDPAIRKMHEERFQATTRLPEGTTDVQRALAFNRFLIEIQADSDRRQREFLHSLGVKALLTGNNFHDTQPQTYLRTQYDYIDTHGYWDHPRFPDNAWSLPFLFSQMDCVTAAAAIPRNLMATRVFGKPMALTEWNFLWPNSRRAEGSVLMPAYASLQDWDALYDCGYGSVDAPKPTHMLQTHLDPVNFTGDHVAARMFRRGDIRPATSRIVFGVRSQTSYGKAPGTPPEFPSAFTMLGLVTGIGSIPMDQPPAELQAYFNRVGIQAVVTDEVAPGAAGSIKIYPLNADLAHQLFKDGVLTSGHYETDEIMSETGQEKIWPAKGKMALTSDRSECFVLPAGETLAGHTVRAKSDMGFSVVMVSSVDDKPLAQSGRLVIVHLTDSLNTNQRFADQRHQIVEDRGQLPILVRRGEATVSLSKMERAETLKAWAIDPAGKRLHKVPLTHDADGLTLKAQTISAAGTCMAYELAEE